MKADLAIYINMFGVPGQYKSVALINWILVVVPIRTVFTETVTYTVNNKVESWSKIYNNR